MRTLLLFLPVLMLSAQTAPAPKAPTPVKTASSAKAAPVAAKTAPAAAPAKNYKEIGSPTATVTMEAYTDYECPHCARFFKEFMPQFTKDYIQTGKVKFLHRDFPLPMHTHGQIAALFANAAGEAGLYEIAVNQIFNTQDIWGMYGKNTGDIDGELSKVIPADAMKKIRALVKEDTHLDEGTKGDVTMGQYMDHINQTPTIVIVGKNGKRELLTSLLELPYATFRKYLDGKISGQ